MQRKEFLKGATLAGAYSVAGEGFMCSSSNAQSDAKTTQNATGAMAYRTLGRSGERVSAIGMGGFHLGKPTLSEAESIRLIRSAIDGGITFMDNSWDYNGGQSEIRMGKALKDGYRKKVFLMTKLDGRTKQDAARQLDESLRRLQTDHVDLIQHHEVLRYEDPDRIFAEGGANEAVVEARKAGKVRYIGFTGHKDPHVHLYMLEVAAHHDFRFDTVQMPLNLMDAHYRSFSQLVLPKLTEQGIGVLGMKSMGDHVILESGVVQPVECLRYALTLPTSVVITGIDSQKILEQAFQVARNFNAMSQQEVAALLARTAKAAAHGEYELFKTSAHFDSTALHPEWLGGQTPIVTRLAGPAI